jgi:cell division protein FtsI (penicillin-binding protein 3)
MPPAGKPPEGRRQPRKAPWREDDDFFADEPPRPRQPKADRRRDEPPRQARAGRGDEPPRQPRAGSRRGYTRDELPPWREALRRKARAEAEAGVPWREPARDRYREPGRPVPHGASGRGPRSGASARRATRAPRHSTGTVRRVSTGPRKIVRGATGNHHVRVVTVRFLLIAALVAAGLKLVQVQGFEAEALAAKAEEQRSTPIDIPATRGSIVDRKGTQLAFSVESRALAFRPRAVREVNNKAGFDEYTAEIARAMHEVIGERAAERAILAKLRADASYVMLIDEVEPADARELQARFPDVISEYRAMREYPGGSLASNIVGVANWRMENEDPKKHNLRGLSGLEGSRDGELSGKPGRQIVDTKEGSQSLVIPGTERDLEPATDGSDIELTIDADLQYFLQQALADYVARARARGGSAVILDAHTGEVYALANDKSFDPTAATFDLDEMGNPAVANPYEPGSVNKIVTALCAIEDGISEPDDVHQVAYTRQVADRTVKDAWEHPTLPFTTTGIFAKSSNVGTLMLAEQCGEDRFAELLEKLGLGQSTGVGLPGESDGKVPPRGQWSGSTFGNLPIGQGLSMTVLQMAAMYQTVANDGVRVPPRIVSARITPEGKRIPEPKPRGVRVVSEQTARTVRDMFRATVQDGDGLNDGTGTTAALTGYQISGKTGTGQQIDPETKGYSQTLYWITFAGILPADDPRFVVGIVLDRPDYYGGEIEGRSAAPLFHDVASYLAQRYVIPLSDKASPVVTLVAE